MVCPMKFNNTTMDKNGEMITQANQCEVNNCAWWDNDGRRCCILSLAYDIFRVAEVVDTQPYEDYNPWREHGSHEPVSKR